MIHAALIFFAACSLAIGQGLPTYKPSQGWPSGSPLLPNDKCVLSMNFDDGSAKDWSRYNMGCGITNVQTGLTFSAQSLRIQQSVSGLNFLDIPAPGVSLMTNFSISIWATPTNVGSATLYKTILAKSAPGDASCEYELFIYNSGVFYWRQGATGTILTGAILAANTRYHLVVTRASGKVYLYVNSVLATNSAAALAAPKAAPTYPTRIGQRLYSTSNVGYQGDIDSITIFDNYVFSQADINLLYELGN